MARETRGKLGIIRLNLRSHPPHLPYHLFKVNLPFLFSDRDEIPPLCAHSEAELSSLGVQRENQLAFCCCSGSFFFPLRHYRYLDLRTTLLTNFTQVNPPKTFTVNKCMQKYIDIVSAIVCSSPKRPFVPCPGTELVQWCFDPDFQTGGFLMKMDFLLIFMLVQCAPLIVFSTFFQRLCFLTALFEDNFNGIISSSLPVSCKSILPAHSWFS